MWPHVEPELIAIRNKFHICWQRWIENWVYQSFIEVQHEELLLGLWTKLGSIKLWLGERYWFFSEVVLCWAFEVFCWIGKSIIQQVDKLFILLEFKVWSANAFSGWVKGEGKQMIFCEMWRIGLVLLACWQAFVFLGVN